MLNVDSPNNQIDNAFVNIYRTDDFNAGRLDRSVYLVAFTLTKNDGRWENPIYLDPGISYTILIIKGGAVPQTKVFTVT